MSERIIFNNHRGVMGRSLGTIPGLSLAEVSHSGGENDEHSHADAHFWLMLKGSYQVECGRRRETVGRSVLVYTAPDQPHRDHIRERDGFGMTIAIGSEFVADQLGSLKLPGDSRIYDDPRLVTIARRMRAELGIADAASPVVVTGLALDLLGQICRGEQQRRGHADVVRAAMDLVHERSADEGLSVAQIAAELEVHPVYLARAFQARLGYSPTEFIRLHRCERAADLLPNRTLTLSFIAHSCGFGDQSSFTRAFSRTFGTTPGRYRALI
jgi:AraC family transcriptional regulator